MKLHVGQIVLFRPAPNVVKLTALDGTEHKPGDRYRVLGTAVGGYVRLERESDGAKLNLHPNEIEAERA